MFLDDTLEQIWKDGITEDRPMEDIIKSLMQECWMRFDKSSDTAFINSVRKVAISYEIFANRHQFSNAFKTIFFANAHDSFEGTAAEREKKLRGLCAALHWNYDELMEELQ